MQNENDCRAFCWKDGGTNFQFSEANSSTFDKENWLEERNSSIVAIEKLESVLRVSIEEDKIRNIYLRKIFHAIVLMCCIIILILILIFNQT